MISDENEITFSERLKKLRKAAGLTQKQLASTLEISVRNIEDWERRLHIPPPWVQRLLFAELERLPKKP